MGIKKDFCVEITTADTDTDVYLRTSGRIMKVNELTITNRNTTTASRVRLWDGPSADARLKFDIIVGPEESVVLNTNFYREFKYGNIVGQATVVPITISGSGFEE